MADLLEYGASRLLAPLLGEMLHNCLGAAATHIKWPPSARKEANLIADFQLQRRIVD